MQNNIHSHANNLGVFGWNSDSILDIKLTTDSDGNVYIHNSGIESALPSQLPGTALYDTSDSQTPIDELVSSPYSLNLQQLLQPGSSGSQFFKKKPCGNYQEADGILTWTVDHYQLEKPNGTVIVFRPDGQLNYVEDSNGYRLTAGYTGDVLTELSASNDDSFTLAYNSSGRIETVTDNNGQTNSYNYDTTGQYLLSVEDVNGTTSFSYDNPFDPTVVSSVTYSDGSKVNYDYDYAGRLQQVIYGEGREALATTYRYDDNGGVTVTDSSGATNQQLRNEQGQVSQTIDPNGRTTDYSYDEVGNLVGIDGELEYSASFTYDDDGNITSQTNALNQTTSFTYDAELNKLSGFKDARGNDVLYSYDNAGNLTSIIYEDGTTDKYVYNADGLLTKSVNRRGQDITYDYNNKYQITRETHSDGKIIEYGYNATDELLNYIVDSSTEENTRIQYDQAKNRLSFNNSNGLVGIYTFDELGRKTQIVIQDGTNTYTTNYSYDSLGRLDQLTDGSGKLIVDYDYHSVSGQLVKETNGNGTYTSYSYDLAGQLVSLVNAQGDGTVNSRFDYIYDNLGRRTEVDTLDGTWSYEYDLSGQLTGAVFASTNPDIESQDLTYVYDAAGNRTQTIVNGVTENYSTNNLNQYQSAGTTTYSYDLDGNLTSKTEGGQTWTYSYNDDNRLVEVLDGDNNLTQYEYDAFGNRTATVYNGQRTEYLIDPFGYGDVIAEYDGDGNLIAKYEHGIGLVSRTDGSNNQSFYDFDGTGSTAGLTGQAGTELNSYNYRPFGEDFHEVETVENSFEYVGQWGVTEEANGLDFMRARYYDSHSGRFVASDPIGLQGQDSNFYRYVNNDPIGYIDPEGTTPVHLGLGGLFVGGAVGGFFASKTVGASTVQGYGASFIAAGLAISKLPGGVVVALPFQLFGSGLVLGATAAKLSSPGGIGLIPPVYAEDAEDGFEGAEAQVWRPACPLILDLDGDGIELTSLEDSDVYFDVDGDGFREKTGWLKSDDGLLVFDRNGDGYINDNSELFGNETTGGFTELKELDSNNDGQITAADTNFADLQVWRDLDEDGRSDVNELFSLDELNIVKIDAVGDSVNITNEGHLIDETGSFELADGTQREVANVWFNLDQLDSYYDHNSTLNPALVITEQILNLPNLRGYGNLPDLRIAMAEDSTLLDLVQSFTDNVNSGDVAAARQLMRPIMYRWAGVDGVDPTDNYPNAEINIQELRFLETFVGRSWNNTNPNSGGADTLANTYEQLQGDFETRLLVQLTESPVTYNTVSETYQFSGSLDEAVAQFKATIIQSQNSASEILELQALALAQYIQQESGEQAGWILEDILNETLTGTETENKLYGWLGYGNTVGSSGDDTLNAGNGKNRLFGGFGNDSLVSGSGQDTLYGQAGDDTLRGGSGNDLYYGGDGNDLIGENAYDSSQDTLIGGAGDDYLSGSGGNDTYLFNKGYGSDTISDSILVRQYARPSKISSGGNDTLRFGAGITRDNLTWNFDGLDLTFTLTDSPNDSLTIENYYNSFYRIENIEVEGSTLTTEEIFGSQTWRDTSKTNSFSWLDTGISYNGLDGDDTITTGDYNDRIWGDIGNDSITSGAGDDNLSGGADNDSLEAGDGDDTVNGGSGDDTVGAGNGNNRLVGGSGNDSLVSGSGEDVLYGQAGDDTIRGGSGNDVYYGGSGNDLIEDIRRTYYSYSSYNRDSDTIDGGWGNDTLKGGGGEDVYIFNRGYGNDLVSDYSFQALAYQVDRVSSGGNNDTIVFGNNVTQNNLIWNFNGKDLIFSLSDSPDDSLTIENYANSFYYIENIQVEDGQLTAEEIIGLQTWRDTSNNNSLSWLRSSISYQGLAGDDTITAGDYDNRLWGNYGDDIITSGSGNDLLFGNVGNDKLNAGSGNDTLDGGDGDDTLGAGNGDNKVSGGVGNDSLFAGSGLDTLDGGDGNDTLNGGYGNDAYYGGDGNDLLSDSYKNNLSDSDTLDGGTGNDTLRGGGGNDTYIFDQSYGQDLISDYGTYKSYYQAPRTTDGGASDTLIFGSGITRDNLRWNFDGLDLSFTLTDSPGDRLTVKNYYNSIYRIENIEVEGSQLTKEEIIELQTWQDTSEVNILDWSETAISFKGLAGNDTITTGGYDDEIWGDAGNDTLEGRNGNDDLIGSDGNDRLIGEGGDDYLNGGNGDDTLDGGAGNDTISAYGGDDTIITGAGRDEVNGGEGIDTVVYNDVAYGDGNNVALSQVANTVNYNNTDTLTDVEFIQFSDVRISADTLEITPVVEVAELTVTEGNSGNTTARIDFNLATPAPVDITFDYNTEDLDAIAGEDYLAASGQVTIPAGETNASVDLKVMGDLVYETAELFALNFSNLWGATFSNNRVNYSLPITIKSDDILPLRVNAGENDVYTDSLGKEWLSNDGLSGERNSFRDNAIAQTDNDPLYQSEYYGQDFDYSQNVANGSYDVTLHFAETVFYRVGQRVFDVSVEDRLILDNFDIISEAGGKDIALEKTFTVGVNDGTLNLDFLAEVNNAKISAVEIKLDNTIARVNGGDEVYIDSLGLEWLSNDGLSGGRNSSRDNAIAQTDNDFLYQTEYYGEDFDYSQSVANGNYDVTLHFAETVFYQSGSRVFDVSVEDQLILDNFDIIDEAGGKDIALEKTFTVGVNDGTLDLNFLAEVNNAKISAIEIKPDNTIARVNGGKDDVYTDSLGLEWSANDGLSGGRSYANTSEIAQTDNDPLYQSEYYGQEFDYSKDVANGSYDVTLHFAEIYFNDAGRRVFDVTAEDQLILDNFDIFSEAGGKDIALERTFTVGVNDGTLDLDFVAEVNNAKVSAVEIKPSII